MNAISLAAGKLADPFLLVAAGKIEPGNIRTRVHFPLTKLKNICPARDLFPDGFVRIKRIARLVYVAKFDGRPDPELAPVGVFLFSNKTKQCGLAGTVRSYHTYDATGRKRKFHLLEQELVVVTLRNAVSFDHGIAEPLAGRDKDLEVLTAFFRFGRDELFVIVDARFRLGMPPFRRHPYPFKLAFECLLSFVFGFLLLSKSILFLLKPRRVISLPRNAFSAIELQDPSGDIIEKIPVVRHRDDSAFVPLQMLLKPAHSFGVEMVCRLIEQ